MGSDIFTAPPPNDTSSLNQRCPRCGQFISGGEAASHTCPTSTEEQELAPGQVSQVSEITSAAPVREEDTSSDTIPSNSEPELLSVQSASPSSAPTPLAIPSNPARWATRLRQFRRELGSRIEELTTTRQQQQQFEAEQQAGSQAALDNTQSQSATSLAPKLGDGSPAATATYDSWVAAVKAARSDGSGGPAYQTEAVLGQAATRFGVELEFKGADGDHLARKLYDLGLAVHPTMVGYHHGVNSPCSECEAAGPGKWKVERDGSVTEVIRGRNIGGEVVSPVLTDCPADWEALHQVSTAITDLGGRADHNTGQHVHVSTAAYENKPEHYHQLATLVAQNEDLLYRLSSPDVDYHRGLVRTDHAAYHYAQPISPRVERLTTQNPQPNLAQVLDTMGVNEPSPHYRNVPMAHYLGLNMQHVNQQQADKSRVEFRIFNGTVDPVQIQTNVRIAAGLVYAASAASSEAGVGGEAANYPVSTPTVAASSTDTQSTPPQRELGWHVRHRRQAEDSQQIRTFIDRLGCLAPSGAKAVLDTFLRSKWQRRSR